MDNRELYHYGVLGMKWGVRRYQNADGTLTEAGKSRLGSGSNQAPGKLHSKVHGEVANDYRQFSSTFRSTSEAANSLKNISDHARNNKRSRAMKKIDVTQMSDQELRERINRMNMEKQYRSLMTEDIDSGGRYVSNILATVGDVMAVGASAASIAVAIHTLRK